MKIGLAQINPTVGDLPGNTELILKTYQEAIEQNVDLVVFPELVLTGYPPEDLLLRKTFVQDNLKALQKISTQVNKAAIVLGFIDQNKNSLFNAAAWIENKKIKNIYHKHLLPNYGVFDEKRYFTPGSKFFTHHYKDLDIGITICEDIWLGKQPLVDLVKLKPDIVLNLSASPFHAGKINTREKIATDASKFFKAPIIYCNLIGGQDELVFDGGSFIINKSPSKKLLFPLFKNALFTAEIEKQKKSKIQIHSEKVTKPISNLEQIHEALLLGLKDYVKKNKFSKVAIGLSGGIDSALVAALATEALGAENVIGVTMPSQFNTVETKNDAYLLAENLKIKIHEIPIQDIFQKYLHNLEPLFKDIPIGLAEENLQARVRGGILMALSNKFGWLILTTGNKSEMSTGYCTLYGDTAGGFAVIKDVLKTTVYSLCELINKKHGSDIIPRSIIIRPPTAELRANQKDEDSLGAYADLDPIIKGYVEENKSLKELEKLLPGRKEYIERIIRLIDQSEYKRRQAPPGVKITPRAFGRDYRMPITNRYRQSF